MLYPTTCVGFGYGPTVSQTDRAGFLGSLLLHDYQSLHAALVLSGFSSDVSAVRYAYAIQRTISSVRACFASPSPLVLDTAGLRNIDRMSIVQA